MKKLLVVPILAIAIVAAGCGSAVVNTILKVAVPALTNILTIVAIAEGKPVNANLVAKIQADGVALETTYTDVSKAVAGATGGCPQFIAALGAFQADIASVEAVAQVKDTNTQTKIALLTSLVVSTVDIVTANIPACQPAAASSPTRSFSIKPYATAGATTTSEFVSRYNTILTAKTGNAAVDAATPKLALPKHGPLVHVLTFGEVH